MKKIASVIALAAIVLAWTERTPLMMTDTYSHSTTETIIILTEKSELANIVSIEKLAADTPSVSQGHELWMRS